MPFRSIHLGNPGLEDIITPHRRPGVPGIKYNVSLPFSKDKKTNIEALFYKVLRCTAVHHGTFSSVAYLTKRTPEGDVLRLTEPAGIPESWIVHLVEAMSKTPELAVSIELADTTVGTQVSKEIGKTIGKPLGAKLAKEIARELDEDE